MWGSYENQSIFSCDIPSSNSSKNFFSIEISKSIPHPSSPEWYNSLTVLFLVAEPNIWDRCVLASLVSYTPFSSLKSCKFNCKSFLDLELLTWNKHTAKIKSYQGFCLFIFCKAWQWDEDLPCQSYQLHSALDLRLSHQLNPRKQEKDIVITGHMMVSTFVWNEQICSRSATVLFWQKQIICRLIYRLQRLFSVCCRQ